MKSDVLTLLDIIGNACYSIKEDYRLCHLCPLLYDCLEDTPFMDALESLNDESVKALVDLAENGENSEAEPVGYLRG